MTSEDKLLVLLPELTEEEKDRRTREALAERTHRAHVPGRRVASCQVCATEGRGHDILNVQSQHRTAWHSDGGHGNDG